MDPTGIACIGMVMERGGIEIGMGDEVVLVVAAGGGGGVPEVDAGREVGCRGIVLWRGSGM